jgi:spermidine synthase
MFSKLKAALSSVILAKDRDFAMTAEDVLYEGQTMSGLTRITQNANGIRILRFGQNGPRQSVVKIGDLDYLGLPYAKAAMIGLAFTDQVEHILVIGLGGGTIPMFLRKHYPNAHIDVVDVDPQIIALAKRYFNFREDDSLRAYLQDGRKFTTQIQKPYDLIFLDAFTETGIPGHLATKEFLLALKKVLKLSGVIIANIWGTQTINPLYKSMLRTYQEVFHEVYRLNVPEAGNKVVIALPVFKVQPLSNIAERAHQVSIQKQLPFNLSEILNPGLIKLIDLQDNQILQDQDR